MTEHEVRNDQPVVDPVAEEICETPMENAAVSSDMEPAVSNEASHDEGHSATWHSEAGRKGALRIHELIEAGRRYEQEHGLKSGRQRLRQLIELGKRYEQEHGLRPAPRRSHKRLTKTEREELVSTLLHCLTRMAKPSFRAELEALSQTLASKKAA